VTGASGDLEIAVDDPSRDDVGWLLETHLEFSRSVTPPEYMFALDAGGLSSPDVTFFSARRQGELLGIGALKHLDASHAELKSMHTQADARRSGVGRAMVVHLLDAARAGGYRRVSLETGTMDAYAPARRLYTALGFRPCPPFAGYADTPYNTCMTLALDGLA
jgi:putative acetyltransferase